jgi:glutathione synthase/RimK-type ligase-like ATP-grasp enzyme
VRSLVVVENVQRWPFELEGVEVVSARDYLTSDAFLQLRGAVVYNVCRRYSYQSLGYYVSLLAAARGHRPIPSVSTLQAVGLSPVLRTISSDLDPDLQRLLAPLRSDSFDLSIYFGRNLTRRYDPLARALFDEFPAPFLRARFLRDREGRWRLNRLRPIATSEIPDTHRDFVLEQATRYFRRRAGPRRPREYQYSMAILWSAEDPGAPSNARAIRRLIRAAGREGIEASIIDREEAPRIAEYDALFLRETTAVEHHTYRLARRAAQEGLVVIDDPDSIIRCSNKVYQAELFRRHRIPAPPTLVVHEGNAHQIGTEVGLPCVLKRPDGSFSRGVMKAETEAELERLLPDLFRESDLLVAQAWTPSTFDWRIGILGGRPLFAARYHMARGHWQIIRGDGGEGTDFGRVEAVPLGEVPALVMKTALRAAAPIGRGFYGADVKEVEGQALVMEVNDNPNLDAGYEDRVEGEAVYREIMRHFRRELDARGGKRDPEAVEGKDPSGSRAES